MPPPFRSRLMLCSALTGLAGIAASAGMFWAVGNAGDFGVDQQSMAQLLGNVISVASLAVAVASVTAAQTMDHAKHQPRQDEENGREATIASLIDFSAIPDSPSTSSRLPVPLRHMNLIPEAPGPVVIDESGTVIPKPDAPAHFGYPEPDFDLIGFTVRNMGCVDIERGSIRLRPSRVAPRALAGLMRHLGRLPADAPVNLRIYEDGWLTVPCRSVDEARHAVLHAVEHGVSPYRGFSCTNIGRLETTSDLGDVFTCWQDAGQRLNDDVMRYLKRRGVFDRAVVMSEKDGDLCFRFIGDGIIRVLGEGGREWAGAVIGRPDNGMPDPVYAASVAEGYWKALQSDTPAINVVDAVMNLASGDRVRLRYERFIAPIQAANGQRAILVCSRDTARQDLGLQTA